MVVLKHRQQEVSDLIEEAITIITMALMVLLQQKISQLLRRCRIFANICPQRSDSFDDGYSTDTSDGSDLFMDENYGQEFHSNPFYHRGSLGYSSERLFQEEEVCTAEKPMESFKVRKKSVKLPLAISSEDLNWIYGAEEPKDSIEDLIAPVVENVNFAEPSNIIQRDVYRPKNRTRIYRRAEVKRRRRREKAGKEFLYRIFTNITGDARNEFLERSACTGQQGLSGNKSDIQRSITKRKEELKPDVSMNFTIIEEKASSIRKRSNDPSESSTVEKLLTFLARKQFRIEVKEEKHVEITTLVFCRKQFSIEVIRDEKYEIVEGNLDSNSECGEMVFRCRSLEDIEEEIGFTCEESSVVDVLDERENIDLVEEDTAGSSRNQQEVQHLGECLSDVETENSHMCLIIHVEESDEELIRSRASSYNILDMLEKSRSGSMYDLEDGYSCGDTTDSDNELQIDVLMDSLNKIAQNDDRGIHALDNTTIL